MEMKVGAPFELVWRNDELTDPPGQRPPGHSEEHRMQSRILALDPPRQLAFSFGTSGEVSFELERAARRQDGAGVDLARQRRAGCRDGRHERNRRADLHARAAWP